MRPRNTQKKVATSFVATPIAARARLRKRFFFNSRANPPLRILCDRNVEWMRRRLTLTCTRRLRIRSSYTLSPLAIRAPVPPKPRPCSLLLRSAPLLFCIRNLHASHERPLLCTPDDAFRKVVPRVRARLWPPPTMASLRCVWLRSPSPLCAYATDSFMAIAWSFHFCFSASGISFHFEPHSLDISPMARPG